VTYPYPYLVFLAERENRCYPELHYLRRQFPWQVFPYQQFVPVFLSDKAVREHLLEFPVVNELNIPFITTYLAHVLPPVKTMAVLAGKLA